MSAPSQERARPSRRGKFGSEETISTKCGVQAVALHVNQASANTLRHKYQTKWVYCSNYESRIIYFHFHNFELFECQMNQIVIANIMQGKQIHKF